MKLSRVTQRMANEHPDWSSIRSDEQSLGFQFLNVLGNQIEELDKQLVTLGTNYFIPTVNLGEIDLVYNYILPGNFAFTVNTNNTDNLVYTPPTVQGQVGSNWYTVTQATNNDIRSFWYTSVPTRISATVTNTGANTILSSTAVSGNPFTSFTNPFIPGVLNITLSGGSQYLQVDNTGFIRTSVIVEGINRKGLPDTETLIFLYNDTKPTVKEWSSLTRVSVFGVTPNTATITIKALRFNNGPYLEFWNLDMGVSSNKVDTFWNIGIGGTGTTHTLDMIRFVSEDPKNLIMGLDSKQVVRQLELLNESGATFTPLDMAIQPQSDNIWVCSASRLYLFDNSLSYPNLSKLDKKEYDSIAILEPDNYHKVLNDTLTIDILFKRPIKEVDEHRITVILPDNSIWGLLNNTLVNTSTNYWVEGQLDSRALRPEESLSLTQRGDYLFTLEVTFTDGSSVIDQRVVSVDSKKALISFPLGFTATGLAFDSDQKLWVLDNIGTKHRIDLAYDVMLVDYDNKIIYFKENYSAVTIVV